MDDQEEKVNNSATSEAANLALAITRVAERAANEEELRIGVEKLLEPTLQRLWRDWDVLRSLPLSTTYRLLARHGWRKVQPNTKHPKSKPEIRELSTMAHHLGDIIT